MNRSGQYAGLVESAVHREIERVCQVFAEPIPVSEIVEVALGGNR
jgi:hypothetical protein